MLYLMEKSIHNYIVNYVVNNYVIKIGRPDLKQVLFRSQNDKFIEKDVQFLNKKYICAWFIQFLRTKLKISISSLFYAKIKIKIVNGTLYFDSYCTYFVRDYNNRIEKVLNSNIFRISKKETLSITYFPVAFPSHA